MDESAFDLSRDDELLVYADWLEDNGRDELAGLLRRAPAELAFLAGRVARLAEVGHVHANAFKLLVHTLGPSSVTAYKFSPTIAHSGRRLAGVHIMPEDSTPGSVSPAGVCWDARVLGEMARCELFSPGGRPGRDPLDVLACKLIRSRLLRGRACTVRGNLSHNQMIASYSVEAAETTRGGR